MQLIERRFSYRQTDFPAMQHSVEAVTTSIEKIVREGVADGKINESLLRAALCALAHSSARAQEEYESIRDESLPGVWTEVTHGTERTRHKPW